MSLPSVTTVLLGFYVKHVLSLYIHEIMQHLSSHVSLILLNMMLFRFIHIVITSYQKDKKMWFHCSLGLCWSLSPMWMLGSGQPSEFLLGPRDMLHPGPCRSQGPVLLLDAMVTSGPEMQWGPCLGPWPYWSQGQCWYLWPVSPQGTMGTMPDGIRGQYWDDPVLCWPYNGPCPSLEAAANELPPTFMGELRPLRTWERWPQLSPWAGESWL